MFLVRNLYALAWKKTWGSQCIHKSLLYITNYHFLLTDDLPSKVCKFNSPKSVSFSQTVAMRSKAPKTAQKSWWKALTSQIAGTAQSDRSEFSRCYDATVRRKERRGVILAINAPCGQKHTHSHTIRHNANWQFRFLISVPLICRPPLLLSGKRRSWVYMWLSSFRKAAIARWCALQKCQAFKITYKLAFQPVFFFFFFSRMMGDLCRVHVRSPSDSSPLSIFASEFRVAFPYFLSLYIRVCFQPDHVLATKRQVALLRWTQIDLQNGRCRPFGPRSNLELFLSLILRTNIVIFAETNKSL